MAGHNPAKFAIQTLFQMVYPPQCISCGVIVAQRGALCPSCWRDAQFVSGVICDTCGAPLVGQNSGDSEICDDCMKTSRPWKHGRAVFAYNGTGRRLVLGLKHADRLDIAPVAARWMRSACSDILTENTIIAPIPLHWTRFLRRSYNQSALLAAALARVSGLQYFPDLLLRHKRTQSLEGKTSQQRYETLSDVMSLNRTYLEKLSSHNVLLVDDVMTSGATFSAAADQCHRAGVKSISVVALARVLKDP